MGKGKKRPHHPTVEELLQRPWCYYCERDFDDLKILHSHQKAKHFRCDRCNRRLNTAGGLAVHMTQVHKEELTAVENALPNRLGLDVEIFGLEGVPAEALQQHNQRIIQQYYENEAERRKATGNPAPGGGGENKPKKMKTETAEDRKARLAEFKAKRAADLAGHSSGNVTPGSPSTTQSGFSQQQQSANFPQPYQSYPGAYGNQQPQTYGQNATFNQQSGQMLPYAQNNQSPPNQHFSQQPPYQQFSSQYPTQTQSFSGVANAVDSNGPPSFPSPANGNYNMPNAQGLPQRPNFSTPTQQGNKADSTSLNTPTEALSLDELVSNAAKAAEGATNPTEDKKEKKTKKESSKNIKLVYSDNNVSPEEKMARLPRYAFNPSNNPEPVLGTPDAAVTGTVRGADTIETQA